MAFYSSGYRSTEQLVSDAIDWSVENEGKISLVECSNDEDRQDVLKRLYEASEGYDIVSSEYWGFDSDGENNWRVVVL